MCCLYKNPHQRAITYSIIIYTIINYLLIVYYGIFQHELTLTHVPFIINTIYVRKIRKKFSI